MKARAQIDGRMMAPDMKSGLDARVPRKVASGLTAGMFLDQRGGEQAPHQAFSDRSWLIEPHPLHQSAQLWIRRICFPHAGKQTSPTWPGVNLGAQGF